MADSVKLRCTCKAAAGSTQIISNIIYVSSLSLLVDDIFFKNRGTERPQNFTQIITRQTRSANLFIIYVADVSAMKNTNNTPILQQPITVASPPLLRVHTNREWPPEPLHADTRRTHHKRSFRLGLLLLTLCAFLPSPPRASNVKARFPVPRPRSSDASPAADANLVPDRLPRAFATAPIRPAIRGRQPRLNLLALPRTNSTTAPRGAFGYGPARLIAHCRRSAPPSRRSKRAASLPRRMRAAPTLRF